MVSKPNSGDSARHPATHDDVVRLFRDIDDVKAAEILKLGPTVQDLEEVAVWAAGEDDVMGELERPLTGAAAAVYEVLTADETVEEER